MGGRFGMITIGAEPEQRERVVDLIQVEGRHGEIGQAGVIAVDLLVLGEGLGVVRVLRVGSRGDQLVAAYAAAVFGRSWPSAGGADCRRRGLTAGQDDFEPHRMLPAIPEVVLVEQHVTGIGQDLVEAHLLLGNAVLALARAIRAEVVLGAGTVA